MSENDKRGMPDQIPSRQNEGETGARISEQNGIQGERKEVDVKDYPKAAALGQILKDLEFPADKQRIVQYVQRATPQSQEILQDLQGIPEKEYDNVSDVAQAAGLVKH